MTHEQGSPPSSKTSLAIWACLDIGLAIYILASNASADRDDLASAFFVAACFVAPLLAVRLRRSRRLSIAIAAAPIVWAVLILLWHFGDS